MEDAYAEEHDGYAQIHIAAGIKTVSLPVVFEEMKKCTQKPLSLSRKLLQLESSRGSVAMDLF
jgi:hypothetical protein